VAAARGWARWAHLRIFLFVTLYLINRGGRQTTLKNTPFTVSHPEIFEFQDVIKIKNKTTIFS